MAKCAISAPLVLAIDTHFTISTEQDKDAYMNRYEKNRFTFTQTFLSVLAIALLQTGWVHAAEESPKTAIAPPEEAPAQPEKVSAPPEEDSAQPKSPALPSSSKNGLRVDDIVITGTWTPHAQKDSPVEIERITGKMLEQAGATIFGKSYKTFQPLSYAAVRVDSKPSKFRVLTANTRSS